MSKKIFSRYTEFKPWYLLVLKFIEWCLIGCRVWKYSNLTLHPIKPHSIFIQKRTQTRAETWCTWKWFFYSICYLHFVSRNLSPNPHLISIQTTLYIQSNHTLYSFNKWTNTMAETRCTWKCHFFGQYLLLSFCLTKHLTQTTLYIQSNLTLYSFKIDQIQWLKLGVPGKFNFLGQYELLAFCLT